MGCPVMLGNKPHPLEEQSILLIPEPSLQPQALFFIKALHSTPFFPHTLSNSQTFVTTIFFEDSSCGACGSVALFTIILMKSH